MKRNIILCLLSAAILWACVEDKGSYDYREINEVAISGIDGSYTVMPGVQTLRIEPVVEMSDADASDASRFEYLWLAVVAYQTKDTIGRERVLSTTLDLAPRTYELVFKVIDRQTDVVWKTVSSLVVGNAYAKGIMLIGEDAAGNAEAQMISMASETVVMPDMLKDSGLPALRDPIAFIHTGNTADGYIKTWVLTGTGSYYIDRVTQKGTEANNFRSQVFSTYPKPETMFPVNIAPEIKDKAGNLGYNQERVVLCNNGYLYCASLFYMGDFYTNPMNRTADDPETFITARTPYLMYGLDDTKGTVWYDDLNERFMYLESSFAQYSVVLTDNPGDPFPWDQKATGRTLVYAENSHNIDGGSAGGNSFALMRDGTGKMFIYKFYVKSPVEKRNMYEITPIATAIDRATMFAFSSTRTVMFYVADGKLYAYDYNPGNEKCYELTGYTGGRITMLKADTQIDPAANPLYIATWDTATGGTLQKFNVGTDPNTVAVTPDPEWKWSGLTRIKNMSWRATK